MKASSSNEKHVPSNDTSSGTASNRLYSDNDDDTADPEPFTESLPSKRAVFEKRSGALSSSVAPRWSV